MSFNFKSYVLFFNLNICLISTKLFNFGMIVKHSWVRKKYNKKLYGNLNNIILTNIILTNIKILL